jgi:hypothetical protein
MDQEGDSLQYTDLLNLPRDKLEALKRIHQENIDRYIEKSPITKISSRFNIDLRSILEKATKLTFIIFFFIAITIGIVVFYTAYDISNTDQSPFDIDEMISTILMIYFISFFPFMFLKMLLDASTPKENLRALSKISSVLRNIYEFEDIPISPDTPFSNKRNWDEMLDSCNDFIFIFDKYFNEIGLNLLYDSFKNRNKYNISIIKVITSPSVISEKLRGDFKRFKTEFFKKYNIEVSLKVLCDKGLLGKTHNRFVISDKMIYDVPSPQSVVSGQFSTIKKVKIEFPFDNIYENSLDIITDWTEIKQISEKKLIEKEIKTKSKKERKRKLLSIEGIWDIDDWEKGKDYVKYIKPSVNNLAGSDPQNAAIALFEGTMEKGIVRAKVNFAPEGSTIARIIIGHDSVSGGYYSVGIGGYKIAYLIDRFDRHVGWRAIYFKGNRNLITRDKTYQLEVEFDNQTINLRINDVEIFRYSIPIQNMGNQVGLFSWGRGNVTFSDIELISK